MAPAPMETVRVGALYPLSGTDAKVGEDIQAGLELAVEIVNNHFDLPLPLAKGLGLPGKNDRKIELVFWDTQGDPVVASKGVDALVQKERVVAVMGCYHSRVTALASEQAEMTRIPFLNAESTSHVLIERGLKWFFRTTPDDRMFSNDMFEFLNDMRKAHPNLNAFPLALVYENGLWGTSVAQAQQRLARQHGYPIALDMPYDAIDDRFDSEINKLAAAMPAVVLQASYNRDALSFMKGYRAMPVQPLAILAMDAGFVSPDFIPTLGADAELVFSRDVWAPDLSEKKNIIQVVNDLFRARYRRDMTGNSARSFTGLLVLADALNRSETLSSEAIRKALLETNLGIEALIMPWNGLRFDPETGQNILGRGIIVQVQQGRYTTVWPKSLAVQSPIWPPVQPSMGHVGEHTSWNP